MLADLEAATAEAVRSGTAPSPDVQRMFPSPSPGVLELMTHAAGETFADGTFRLLDLDEVEARVRDCEALVPEAKGRVRCYGTDWLGRNWGYYVDEPRIVVIEPYSAEMLSADFTVAELLGGELAAGELLEPALWKFWTASHPAPAREQCVGLSVPMFVGGDLVAENLSLFDRDVYWELCTQLRKKVEGLPAGTPIQSVSIDDGT